MMHDVVGCGRLDGQIYQPNMFFETRLKSEGLKENMTVNVTVVLPPRHLPTNTYGYQHLVACRPEEGRYLISFQMTAVRKK